MEEEEQKALERQQAAFGLGSNQPPEDFGSGDEKKDDVDE